jgi:integrase
MWRKKVRGKVIYCGYSPRKKDRERYRLAVENWKRIKSQIDAGTYDPELEKQIRLAERDAERKRDVRTSKKSKTTDTSRKWTPKQVNTVLRKFHKFNQARVNAGEMTPSRMSTLRTLLAGFGEFFGSHIVSSITENDISRFANYESAKVASGQLKVSSLGQNYKAVRQFFHWCWKQRIINERPRNLDILSVKIPKKQNLYFDKKNLKQLMDGCDASLLGGGWDKRHSNEVDYTILRAMILLGVNMGFGQRDVSDLLVGEVHLRKRPARIIRSRTKTGVATNHLMWNQTRELLKQCCQGKKPSELVFRRPDGRELIPYTIGSRGNITGGRADYIGNKFKRLVKRVLGEDETRTLRDLRKTGANFCKQRFLGSEKMYLGHTDGSMSMRYTDTNQKLLDTAICFMEKDLGFTNQLQPYYEGRNRRKTK